MLFWFLGFRTSKGKTRTLIESFCRPSVRLSRLFNSRSQSQSIKTIYLEIANRFQAEINNKYQLYGLLNHTKNKTSELMQSKDLCIEMLLFLWNSPRDQNFRGHLFPWTYSYKILHEMRTHNKNIFVVHFTQNKCKLMFVNFYKFYSIFPVNLPSWNWWGSLIGFTIINF